MEYLEKYLDNDLQLEHSKVILPLFILIQETKQEILRE